MQMEISEPVFHDLLTEYLEEEAHPEDIGALIFKAMDALNEWDGEEVVKIYDRIAKTASKEANYLREREL